MDSPAAAVERFLPEATIARINAPLGTATCLPNEAYTSEEFFALEQRLIFRRSWVLAGFADDLRAAGDVVPVEIAGLPLLLCRDREGRIRAFQNVCRHRGARLVEAPCRVSQAIVCPYHAWSYGLDGRLQRRPHFHGGGRHDLPAAHTGPDFVEARCEVWHHWVMVNIDGNARGLAEHYAPMDDKLAAYDFAAMVRAGSLEFNVDCNWKFAHENFIEPYHVFAAHPRLSAFVPMEERRPSVANGHLMWNEYRFRSAEEGRGLGLPHFPGLDGEHRMRGIWFTVFPSFGIEVYPDHIALLQVEPLGAHRTREKITIYLTPEAARASEYAAGRQAVLDMWRDLNAEDIGLLEALQRGRRAPGYDGGVLSPYWDEAPRHFARLVAETMRDQARA